MSLINDMLRNLEARRGADRHLPPGLVPGGGRAPTASLLRLDRRWLIVATLATLTLLLGWLVLPPEETAPTQNPRQPQTPVVVKHLPPPQPAAPAASAAPAPAPGPAPTAQPEAQKPPSKPPAVSAAAAVPPSTIERTARVPTGTQLAEQAYRRGIDALRNGNGVLAETEFRAAIQHDAAHLLAREALAALLLRNNRLIEAGEVLEQGQGYFTQHPVFVLLLARVRVDQKDVAGAVRLLERYRANAQGRADYLAFLGALYQRERRYGDSAAAYADALKLQPAEASWWVGLALALEQTDRPDEAAQAYQQAMSGPLSPELADLARQRLRVLTPQAGQSSNQQ